MTTVKVFNSDQVGAPVVSQTAGSLIAMLDAALVDGFGLKNVTSLTVAGGIATVNVATGHSAIVNSVVLMAGATPGGLNGEKKVLSVSGNNFTFDATGISDQTATGTITTKMAAAGWEKVYSGTNKAVYRSLDVTSTQTYLRIDDSNAQYATPTGYLTMSGVDTGTGAFGASAFFNKTQGTAGNRAWWVVASSKFVYFGVKTHTDPTNGYAICAFGDLIPRRSGDAYRFMISGAQYAANNWGQNTKDMSTVINSNTTAGCYLPRSYAQLGNEVLVVPRMMFSNNCYSGNVALVPFPNGGDNSVILTETHVAENASAVLRGRLPGAYVCPQAPNGTLTNDFAIVNPADLPNRTLLWKLTGQNSSYGGFAVDITGPWA